MSSRLLSLLLLAFSLGFGADLAAAQDVPQRAPAGAEAKDAKTENTKAKDVEAARRRWASLSEAERAELRQRYERLKQLDPEQRRALERRARHLHSVARRIYAGLDDSTRRRLESLSSEERRRVLQGMVAEEAREDSRRLLLTLPEEVRARLEAARPEDREAYLGDLRQRHAGRLQRGLEHLAEELELPEDERASWKGLSRDQQHDKLSELLKRKVLRHVDQVGVPAELGPAGWQRVSDLPPRDFLHAFRRLRDSHPELGDPLESFPGRGRGHRGHRGGRDRGERGGFSHPGLRRALHLPPELLISVRQLPEAERMAAMQRHKAQAALEVIREEQLLQGEELTRYEAMEPGAQLEDLRQRMFGRRHGQRGPGGPGGRRGGPGSRPDSGPTGEDSEGERTPRRGPGRGRGERRGRPGQPGPPATPEGSGADGGQR